MENKKSPLRIFIIFMISVLVSSLTILSFSSSGVTLGASGGVFGLLTYWFINGLLQLFGKKKNEVAGGSVLYAGILLGINIIYSFDPDVSMSGHVGGMIAGAILAFIV